MLHTDELHSEYSSGGNEVTYRIDSQSAVTEEGVVSGGLNENLSPLDGSAFVASLRGAQQFLARTSETPVLTFDVSNLFNTPAQVNIHNCGQ